MENSVAAFRAAIDANVDAIEFDLLHTKDQQTIVFHDKKLGRLTTGENCPARKKVEELSLRELRSLCKLKNGEEVPTLEEVLRIFKTGDSKLFIEFKDKPMATDFELIEEYFKDNPAQVFIVSFKTEVLKQVKSLRKQSAFYQQVKTVKLQKFGYFSNFDGLDVVDAKYIHKAKVKRLQREGKLVGVYTKDKTSKIKKYLAKGVDFITTNEPQRCSQIIDSGLY